MKLTLLAGAIGLTVIAISFTIVTVLVPVSFTSGIAGQHFEQFGLTVAVAVLFSLLVARSITPMTAAYPVKDELDVPSPFSVVDLLKRRSRSLLVNRLGANRPEGADRAGGVVHGPTSTVAAAGEGR